MITTTFSFPHPVSRQGVLRTVIQRPGTPVAATIPKPHHASRHVEFRSVRVRAGKPVTTTIAVSQPLTQERLGSTHARVGHAVSTVIAFPYPLVRTELRSTSSIAGSPVTEYLAASLPLKQTSLRSTHTVAGNSVTGKVAFYRLPTQFASLRWKSDRKCYETAMARFRNDYNNLKTNSICYCYDWKTTCGTSLRYRHRSLVPAGWRIVAKNIENDETFDLGFIDAYAVNPVLEDIYIPNGEYEISVLTSSLFWKDCLDRTIRTISVRPDEEVTPFPTIYNLRSSVSEGVTTIHWSANRNELDDCVFGVWYSSESPVDVNRPPDQIVWYFSSQSEYQTSFKQTAPCYVAVASMRTGNESELGKVHELYLDWNNVPPRRPDDVVLLDRPLPAFDPPIESRHEDDPFMSLWNG